MKYLIISLLFFSLLFFSLLFSATAKPAGEMTNSTLKNGGLLMIGIWRNYITKIDGPRCGFRPTCAEYARQAIKKHGYVKGTIMASERLQRCHSCHNYSVYDITKEGYASDPVTANEY